MKESKSVWSWSVICGLALAGLVLAGCQSGSPKGKFAELGDEPPPPAPAGTATATAPATGANSGSGSGTAATAPAESGPAKYDLIKPGDSLMISMTDLPFVQQPWVERVREDGTITLIQNQTFTAADKTRGQLEKEVRARYVPDFFRAMTVSIVPKPESQFYTVGGEVKLPGRQVYLSRIRFLAAIKSAGDFTDFARRSKVFLTRADGQRIEINAIKAQEDPKLDPEIYPGDDIRVMRKKPWQR